MSNLYDLYYNLLQRGGKTDQKVNQMVGGGGQPSVPPGYVQNNQMGMQGNAQANAALAEQQQYDAVADAAYQNYLRSQQQAPQQSNGIFGSLFK